MGINNTRRIAEGHGVLLAKSMQRPAHIRVGSDGNLLGTEKVRTERRGGGEGERR